MCVQQINHLCNPFPVLQDEQLRTVLLQAAEAELASKPTSAGDDERLLQVRPLLF